MNLQLNMHIQPDPLEEGILCILGAVHITSTLRIPESVFLRLIFHLAYLAIHLALHDVQFVNIWKLSFSIDNEFTDNLHSCIFMPWQQQYLANYPYYFLSQS
jgi:hypothetical protein